MASQGDQGQAPCEQPDSMKPQRVEVRPAADSSARSAENWAHPEAPPDAGPAEAQASASNAAPECNAQKGCCAMVCDEILDFLADWFGALSHAHDPEIKPASRMDQFKKPKKQSKYAVADAPKATAKRRWGGPSPSQPSGKVAEGAAGGCEAATAEDEEEGLVQRLIMEGQKWPVFVIGQSLFVLILWIYFAAKDGTEVAGFESIWPGDTYLTVTDDCEDYRHEVWRWFTYQYTHSNFMHVFSNAILLLAAAWSLEGYHGTPRTCLFFQAGVFGGAMCALVASPHSKVVGMSGGCYSMLGMRMGDIILNWNERRYRYANLLFLACMATYDIVQTQISDSSTSHAAHFGGWVSGCLMCTVFGVNVVILSYEKYVQALAFFIGSACIIFCLAWGMSWAPQDIFEGVPWCWARQVISTAEFGDGSPHCVRCSHQGCIDKWSAMLNAAITVSQCENDLGGWAVTD